MTASGFEGGGTQISPSDNEQLERVCLDTTAPFSETELRAAQPRRNPRVFVAVRRIAAVGSPVARLLLFAS